MPGLTYDDDAEVRNMLDHSVSNWSDPDAYAASFSSDAQHIGATGEVHRGRSAIVGAQAQAIASWARASRKTARVDRLQFLSDEVALLTVYGEVRFDDIGAPALRTIESVTAKRLGTTWELVSTQQTPLGNWAVIDRSMSSERQPGDDVPPIQIDPGSDVAEVVRLYDRMLAAWLDAAKYAECFTHDCDYITGGGLLERGWHENVRGHSTIFSAWARDSHLHGRIAGIRFLTDDVAVLTAHGHIVFHDQRGDTGKRTVYTLTARRMSSGWTFVGYQNTPIANFVLE